MTDVIAGRTAVHDATSFFFVLPFESDLHGEIAVENTDSKFVLHKNSLHSSLDAVRHKRKLKVDPLLVRRAFLWESAFAGGH